MGNESELSDQPPTPLVRGERHCKRRGELAELAFVYKAASFGFGVAKPYGDSEHYDFIVDSGERLWRVQVKSVGVLRYGAYYINAKRRFRRKVVAYDPADVDFLISHVVPEDLWYVIPVDVINLRKTVRVYPLGDRRGEYRCYREAWWLMAKRPSEDDQSGSGLFF